MNYLPTRWRQERDRRLQEESSWVLFIVVSLLVTALLLSIIRDVMYFI